MKNKKRVIIITSIVLILLIGGYFLYKILSDEDKDRISRKVMIASYESLFLKEVEKIFGKPYEQFPESEKYNILEKMLKEEKEYLQITAVRYLSKLPDKGKAANLLKNIMADGKVPVIEEIIFSFKNYPKNIIEPILGDFIKNRISDIDYTIPLSRSYRVYGIGSSDKSKIEIEWNESQQIQSSLSDAEVYEINLLLPKGFDYMFSFPNFDDNWVNLNDTKLISKFVKTDSYNDFKRIEAVSDYFKLKKIVDDKVGFLGKFFDPEKLFRDDLKVAKYGKNILLVTFKGRNLEIMTNLVALFRSFADLKFDVVEEPYKNLKIITFQNRISKKTISYSEVSEYFVIADSPDLVRRSLDCFLSDNTNSITFDPCFKNEYAKIDMTGDKNFVFAYFNPTSISLFENKSAYSAYLVKISLKTLKEVLGNEFNESKYITEGFSPNNDDLNLLNFIGKSSIAFFYTNNGDTRSTWNYLVGLRTGFSEELSALASLNKEELEKNIIANLGPKMFWAVNGIDYGQGDVENRASLQFSIGYKLNNNNIAGLKISMVNLFNSLFKKNVVSKFYLGYDIFSSDPVSLNTFTNQETENFIAPSFSVIDGNLIVAINRKIIIDIIDNYKNGAVINKSVVQAGYSDNFYFDMNNFSLSYYKFLTRYAGRSRGFNQFDVEEKVKPFFEVLKLIQNVQYFGSNKEYQYKGKLVMNLN